jgi:hypothetical protein
VTLFGETPIVSGMRKCRVVTCPFDPAPGSDWCVDHDPKLAADAHARNTDPETSHAAASSVGDLRPRQVAVLDVLRRCGPCHDEAIAAFYTGPPQSPSGLRTRRRELVDAGLVRDSGDRARLQTGRQSIVWEVVE